MKVKTEVETKYVLSLSEDEIRWIVENPVKGLKAVQKAIKQAQDEGMPKMLSSTVAQPAINSKVPCPACSRMFEARGMGVHFFRHHKVKLADWQRKHLGAGEISILGIAAPKE